MSRYDPIEIPTTGMIRIFKNGNWCQMRPLYSSVERMKRVVARLRKKGRIVEATWLQGMGLGIG